MIAQTIQLALAPVFVLVAIGNILNLLSNRLGRVVDRSRWLQDRHAETSGGAHDQIVSEIRHVDRRIKLIGRAFVLLVLSGLTIAFTVGLLFLEEMAKVEVSRMAAASFLLSLGFLMTALVLFLYETRLAVAAVRIPRDYLELEREL